jgi:hypothetical protein
MKFAIQPGHGVRQYTHMVWDATENKNLCAFVDGVFETEDKAVIEKLIALGYESELIEGEPEPDDEEELKALRAQAKELGIKSSHLMGIDRLREEIAALEK